MWPHSLCCPSRSRDPFIETVRVVSSFGDDIRLRKHAAIEFSSRAVVYFRHVDWTSFFVHAHLQSIQVERTLWTWPIRTDGFPTCTPHARRGCCRNCLVLSEQVGSRKENWIVCQSGVHAVRTMHCGRQARRDRTLLLHHFIHSNRGLE